MGVKEEKVAGGKESGAIIASVVLVESDDWQGLYVGGKLVMQNHELRLGDVLPALGIGLQKKEADGEWLERRGALPDNLDEVRFET